MEPGGNEAGDMGHVHEQLGIHLVGDGAELGEVDGTGIGAGARHDDRGTVLMGEAAHFVIVDEAGVLVHAVGNHVEQAAGEVHRAAVRQVAAVGQVHAQNGIAWFGQREVGSHVRLAAGVGLHVDVVAAEQLLGALDGKVFGDVDEFAAAVVPLARITFGVLMRENASLRFPNGGRDEVFGGDELQLAHLPIAFQQESACQFGIFKKNMVHWTLR